MPLPGLSNLSRMASAPPPAGSTFNPADLFGAGEAGIWMDPTAGVWQEVAQTNSSTTDGDVVGRWIDQSGNVNAFDQATTANKPLFKTAAGKSWVRFDGVDDYITQAATVGLYNAGLGYVAFAVDSTNMGASKYIFGESNSASTGKFVFTLISATTADTAGLDSRSDSAGTVINSGNVFDNDAYKLDGKIVLEVVDTGSNITVYVNGVIGDGANNNFNYVRATTTMDQSVIGALLRSSVSNYSGFDCYGLVAIGRAVTAQERTDTRTFLNGRLGI